MAERPRRPPRRHSWNRSQSDGFGSIKQVGVAISIGFPLFVVGVIFVAILIVSVVEAGLDLWLLGAGVLVVGLLAALCRRVI